MLLVFLEHLTRAQHCSGGNYDDHVNLRMINVQINEYYFFGHR